MPPRPSKFLFPLLLLVLATLQSCAAGAASARGQASVYCHDEKDLLAAINSQETSGDKIRCMLIPESVYEKGDDTEVLDAIASTGLGVVNAMDSMDAKTVEMYKRGVQSSSFKIAEADKDKFKGVQYIIIYHRGWKWQPEFPNLLHFGSKVEMKFWWVRGGSLSATATSAGDYNWYGDYSGQSQQLTEALRKQRLPGTKAVAAPDATAGPAPDAAKEEAKPASK